MRCAFQSSSLEETKAWMNLSVSERENKYRSFAVFCKWKNEIMQIYLIWLSNVSCGSKITPRLVIGKRKVLTRECNAENFLVEFDVKNQFESL